MSPMTDRVESGAGMKLTYEDFVLFPDDGKRHDPELDVVRVYRRDGDRFARPVELSREAGDILTTPLLPDLTLPLDRVFQE